MPYYEFRCQGCGGFELELTMKRASSFAICPSCGEMAPRVYGQHSCYEAKWGLRQ